MLITGFPAGPWGTNCFVVATGPGSECLVIDPGQGAASRLRAVFEEHHLRPVAVMLTHGHIDHVWSVAPVAHGYGIPAYLHPDDRYRLVDIMGSSLMLSREQLLKMTDGELDLTEPDDVRPLVDGTAVEIAGLQLDVRHAPGHTEGSVAFIAPRDSQDPPVMFSGDLLFKGSIGRTDLPGGDTDRMMESLRRVVLTLHDDTLVLPGHGDATTIGQERTSNPFLTPLADGGAASPPTRGL